MTNYYSRSWWDRSRTAGIHMIPMMRNNPHWWPGCSDCGNADGIMMWLTLSAVIRCRCARRQRRSNKCIRPSSHMVWQYIWQNVPVPVVQGLVKPAPGPDRPHSRRTSSVVGGGDDDILQARLGRRPIVCSFWRAFGGERTSGVRAEEVRWWFVARGSPISNRICSDAITLCVRVWLNTPYIVYIHPLASTGVGSLRWNAVVEKPFQMSLL